MTITVLKLGGSLSTSPMLEQWLEAITAFAQQQNIIVVPGGGAHADHVRSQQRQQGFTDLTAHRLALLAMCQTAYELMEKCPALVPIDASGEMSPRLDQGLPLLWLPLELLNDTRIPASWDFTSDSIALWLADRLQAAQLLLVKKRRLDASADLTDYINQEVIDKGFQLFIKDIKCNIYVFAEADFPRLGDAQAWPAPLGRVTSQ